MHTALMAGGVMLMSERATAEQIAEVRALYPHATVLTRSYVRPDGVMVFNPNQARQYGFLAYPETNVLTADHYCPDCQGYVEINHAHLRELREMALLAILRHTAPPEATPLR